MNTTSELRVACSKSESGIKNLPCPSMVISFAPPTRNLLVSRIFLFIKEPSITSLAIFSHIPLLTNINESSYPLVNIISSPNSFLNFFGSETLFLSEILLLYSPIIIESYYHYLPLFTTSCH
ncbi:MAG: hypothetical protein UR45_C0007G0018 [candidate division WS6 bacterium GW2011_WS6_33_547]|nr:MAG: hypothetical protein UR45_C0007G0018 [candidate division WS6 bacterium GW2011_WS6_33_547]